MYDLIGDIHGHADELELLLKKLGYTLQDGVYSQPDRKIIFLGDYIDRGPKIRETLGIVKSMVESGNALALMGNHEYNAIAFHYRDPKGGHIRPHTIKNISQHFETMRQFKHHQKDYDNYIEWFKTLPLFLEFEEFNVVHACWDEDHISFLKQHLHENKLTDRVIYDAAEKGTHLYNAVEDTLKGKELPMPEGQSFVDKDGHERSDIRVRWWQNPATSTYRSYSVQSLPQLPEIPVLIYGNETTYYHEKNKPVFFGHYWFQGEPEVYHGNVCCLDYSVAKKGKLVAYRWEGESALRPENIRYVNVLT